MAGVISKLIEEIDWRDQLAQVLALAESIGYGKLATGAVAGYVSWKIIYASFFSPLRNIPGPFLARLTGLRSEYIAAAGKTGHYAESEYEKYGDIYVHGPNAVSISNPSDCRTLLGSHAFVKSDFYKSVDILGVHNIFSTRDPLFNQMRRRQVGPSFTAGYLAKMEGKIIQHGTLSLKTKWDGVIATAEQDGTDAIININNDLLFTTFDVTGALAFGRNFNALKNNDPTIIEWVADAVMYFGLITNVPALLYFPFNLFVRRQKRHLLCLADFSQESVDHRKNLLAQGEEKPGDLLAAFMDAVDPESKIRMSHTELLAEMVITLMAGSETSSNTIMWTMHLLMLYPECYKRVVDEVRSTFDKDHTIGYNEGRQNLPYLEAVLYESMRVRPVASGNWPRVVPKGGVTFQGHFLPAGTVVIANFSGVSRHKGTWEDPYRFIPERFLDNEAAKRRIFAFSTGVRICPGRNLAWMEMVTILANMLKDYDFKLPDDAAFGPEICDENGLPKLMAMKHFIVAQPLNGEHDARLIITKAN